MEQWQPRPVFNVAVPSSITSLDDLKEVFFALVSAFKWLRSWKYFPVDFYVDHEATPALKRHSEVIISVHGMPL